MKRRRNISLCLPPLQLDQWLVSSPRLCDHFPEIRDQLQPIITAADLLIMDKANPEYARMFVSHVRFFLVVLSAVDRSFFPLPWLLFPLHTHTLHNIHTLSQTRTHTHRHTHARTQCDTPAACPALSPFPPVLCRRVSSATFQLSTSFSCTESSISSPWTGSRLTLSPPLSATR